MTSSLFGIFLYQWRPSGDCRQQEPVHDAIEENDIIKRNAPTIEIPFLDY